MRWCLFLLVAFLVFSSREGLGEQKRTIMVFYPSPYGEYLDLRSNFVAVGSTVMDSSTYPPQDGEILVNKRVRLGNPAGGQSGEVSYDEITGRMTISNGGVINVMGGNVNVGANNQVKVSAGTELVAVSGSQARVSAPKVALQGSNIVHLVCGSGNITLTGTTIDIGGNVSVKVNVPNKTFEVTSKYARIRGTSYLRAQGGSTTLVVNSGGVTVSNKLRVQNGGAVINGGLSVNGNAVIMGRLSICVN